MEGSLDSFRSGCHICLICHLRTWQHLIRWQVSMRSSSGIYPNPRMGIIVSRLPSPWQPKKQECKVRGTFPVITFIKTYLGTVMPQACLSGFAVIRKNYVAAWQTCFDDLGSWDREGRVRSENSRIRCVMQWWRHVSLLPLQLNLNSFYFLCSSYLVLSWQLKTSKT